MGLTRKFLTALGIEADKVDEIITAHTEVTDGLKAERDSYKADAEKLAGVQAELDGMKAAQEKDGKDPWKVKYEALKEDFDAYKNQQTEKETKARKEAAYKKLLQDAGVAEKRIAAVLRVTDLDSVELDKDGNVKDAEKHTDSIKAEWSDFIQTTSVKGAETATPPQNSGASAITKADILKIKDTGERQKMIAEHHDLFGI